MDFLGEDGLHVLKGIKKAHEKLVKNEQRKISNIHEAVDYFENKMQKRRAALKELMKSRASVRACTIRKQWRQLNENNE